jgi:hypothetical protein
LYGATSYSVNFDALFNGRNKLYRSCFVRLRITGNGEIAKSSISAATGVVSLVGLSSSRTIGNEIQGLVVSPIQFLNGSQVSAAETGYYINIDTTASHSPPQISPPQGITPLTILFSQENGSVMANSNMSAYYTQIFFELVDPINPPL